VKKGEKGVKVVSIIQQHKVNDAGEDSISKRFTSPTVFHISQTEELSR
jgi:hypothetical protein